VQNYLRAIHKRVAETIDEETSGLPFDVGGFGLKVQRLVLEEARYAVLGAVTIADDLLVDMFRREARPEIEMPALLGPLGPMGDFNRRLKVAAIAEFIDDDCLKYFDELRKMRNRIAHSDQPSNPNRSEIERLMRVSPTWLDVIETHEELVGQKVDRGTNPALLASVAVHLSLLAWQSILVPAAKRAGVPISALIERQPKVFAATSSVGMGVAMGVLGYRAKNAPASHSH